MTSYDLMVFVHVVSAIVLVGGGLLVTPTLNAAIRSASSISDIRRWLIVGQPLDRITPVSSIVLLVTGVYLASVGNWWSVGWIRVAVVLWVLNALAAILVLKPATNHLADLVSEAKGNLVGRDIEEARNSTGLTVAPRVILATDLGVLFLMVVKPPGHLIPLAVTLGALALSLAAGALWSALPARRRAATRDTEASRERPDILFPQTDEP